MAHTIKPWQQFRAILWLKFKQSSRDRKFLFLGLLLPGISIALSLIFNFVININPSETMTSFYPANAYQAEQSLLDTWRSAYQFEPYLNKSYTLDELNNDILNNTLMYQLGGYQFDTFNTTTLSFSQNIFFNHSMLIPSFTQSFYMALCEQLVIGESYHTLLSGDDQKLFPMLGPILIQYGYVFLVPYFAILVVIDRDKGIKNHLFLNSLRKQVYWSAYLLADYCLYLVPAILGWAALAIAKIDGFYNSIASSFFLFVCFGLSAIPFGYILQFIFDKEETANKWLYPLSSLICALPSVIITFVAKNGDAPMPVQIILSFLPSYSLYNGLSNLVRHQGHVGITILVQIISCVVYFFVIFLVERIKNRPSRNPIEDLESRRVNSGDDDVAAERETVISGSQRRLINVNGIFKQFIEDIPDDKTGVKKRRIKHAVDGVWFGVENGECFGLLGHNGAGKTTLLNIMTGILSPDEGEGTIDGYSITTQRELAFASVGSCPQFDILFDNLTVAEHLRLFAWIKCLPANQIQTQIDYFIDKFEIQQHKDKRSKELSGGTKRKLSVACSLIGDPKVVFLDEASSGLDPASRRHLWNLISEMKAGKAMVLTTHSMDEADYLCNRIAIMSNGKLKCVNTPMALKHKYGAGYSLDIQPSNLNKTQEIQSYIGERFPEATLVQKLGGMISYDIPVESLSLAKTSLEKVFLKFALEQHASEEDDNTVIVPKKKFLGIF
eukprot:gene11956-13935_t